jgi:Flp pilus assembly protein TadD
MGLVWLAWTYWSDARFHWTESPDDALARADELARCAAVIDDRFAECHALLGAIYLMKKSFDEAVDHGTRAVELEPNGADATATLAMTLAWCGRPEETIELVKKAMRLESAVGAETSALTLLSQVWPCRAWASWSPFRPLLASAQRAASMISSG